MHPLSARRKLAIMCGAVVAMSSMAAFAQNQNRPQRRGPPPKEAVDACADATEGDACSFTGREGETLNGTCHAPPPDAPEGAPMACAPEGNVRPRQGGGGQ